MKLRSTTPVHKTFSSRVILIGMAVLLSVSIPMSMVERAAADKWDNQINALRAQADKYQAEANELKAKGDTLQNKLNQINAQLAALRSDIKANELKNKKLQSDIEKNKKKLSDAQETLGEVLANLYVDGEITALEMLASSQNIGDFVDKQEYRSAVRDQLSTLITSVKKIKAKLEGDKKEVEKVLAELDSQNKQLSATQADQQRLVNQTRGEEAAYKNLVAKAKNSMLAIRAQQQAYYASLNGGGGAGVVGSFQYWGWSGNKGCAGGYPYCMPQDTWVDPWNLFNRECVSYVAWALKHRFGKNVQPWHGDGNAYEWVWSAPRWSNAWRVYSPQPGDVVVLPQSGAFAPIGHVMIVESISGNDMFVSQYNFYGTGQYSTMWVKNSGVVLLRFPS